jgi:arsenite methyltransferase
MCGQLAAVRLCAIRTPPRSPAVGLLPRDVSAGQTWSVASGTVITGRMAGDCASAPVRDTRVHAAFQDPHQRHHRRLLQHVNPVTALPMIMRWISDVPCAMASRLPLAEPGRESLVVRSYREWTPWRSLQAWREREQNRSVTDDPDRWHRWLLDARFGGDAAFREKNLIEFLYPVRDKVLDGAQLAPSETLLDVGTGDGLIAFGALERLGPSGHVIFSDISQDLLDHCRNAAAAEGLVERCRFVLDAADQLTGVPDSSVDVVTTRSVLIFVKDKAAAMREFYRVLKPGGRVSLFEPINVLMSRLDADLFYGYDISPVRDLAARIQALYRSIQPSDSNPMLDFDDRDLVRHAQKAGFPEINMELRVSVRTRREPASWDRFMRTSANALVPTFGEALDQALTPAEVAELTSYLRPLVESGTGLERMALAYLTAAKE